MFLFEAAQQLLSNLGEVEAEDEGSVETGHNFVTKAFPVHLSLSLSFACSRGAGHVLSKDAGLKSCSEVGSDSLRSSAC